MTKYLFYISQNYSFSILRPIQQVLLKRGDQVHWFFEGPDVNSEYLNANEKLLKSIEQIKVHNPAVVLATANSIPTFIPGLKVAVFHGFDAGKIKRNGQKSHFKIRGCFDLYCTQGPNTTKPFQQSQQKLGYFNVIETGWSALDSLFINSQKHSNSKKPVILLCSTFSKRLSCAKHLYKEVSKLSKTGRWQWIIQFHPKMDQQVIDLYKAIQSEHLEYVETDNVIPLLQQADVMVCDTSSVISMFLIQCKPVVTYKNVNPGAYLLDINDPELLEPTIIKALSQPVDLMSQIHHMIKETHPYYDGKSSTRVVEAIDEVLHGKHPLKKTRPLNFLKNLKYRKRLNYWKF